MTGTTINKWSSPRVLKLLHTIVRRSLIGFGVLAIFFIVMLLSNVTARSTASSLLGHWATGTSKLNDAFALAPFEIDPPREDLESMPQGATKLPVAVLASLPILDPTELSASQLKLTNWIANRYRVAPEMVALLVQESWNIAEQTGLDPTLILAIAAIESRFNPYAQSTVGATGLMQVMPVIHAAKFDRTGGPLTIFDPVTNLRVGVQVLQEHVRRAGSLEGGLKQYVGAAGPEDYGYASKVLAERDRIRRVIFGTATPDMRRILLAADNLQTTSQNSSVRAVAASQTDLL